ncbi:hypothetical protein RHMOL_Rhmol13G0129400 [Rhododendron molle]|uniref:Uncharacterized protein n=1 Tax=Rhododendron molle TaxID=49168 RepID=A0ACC0L6P8_RHOML|nr:hypothetical protein RHMOL_Rhmol13G0129400 [Rhododendron molle]
MAENTFCYHLQQPLQFVSLVEFFRYTEPKHEKTLPSSLAPHSAICSTATVPRYLCRGTVALAPLSLSLSTIRSVHSDPSGLHRRRCRLRPRQEQPLCGRRRQASSKIEGPRVTRRIGLKSMGQPSFQTENVSGGDPKSHGSETRWTGLSTNHHRDSHAHCVDKKDIIEENVPEVRQKRQVQERICNR